jgi:hypothetical protein
MINGESYDWSPAQRIIYMGDTILGKAIDFEGGQVRKDYVPAADYVSKEFAELEANHLWPRVWQMACREEEIPTVSSFYTYDIIDDSIIVVRTAPDEIRAFRNSRPHRGRHMIDGCSVGLTYLRARLQERILLCR